MKVTRSTLILCIVAIGCVAGAVFLNRLPGASAADGAGRPVLAGFMPETVTAFRLARRGETALEFERREDGTWWQTEPIEHPLDGFSMDEFTRLGRAVTGRPMPVDDARDLATLGLDPPEAVLTWTGADGTAVGLDLGRRGFAGRAYARRTGTPDVEVVGFELHDRALDMDPKEWRDRRLFTDVSADAAQIDVVVGGVGTTLRRDGRRWSVTEPLAARASAGAVDRLLQALGRAKLAGFVLDLPDLTPDTLAPFGLSDPAATITVTLVKATTEADGTVTRREETQRLLVGVRLGAGTQDRFGAIEGRPTVVRLPEAVLKAFFVPTEALVATPPSGVRPADVQALRVVTDTFDVRVQRELERWVLSDDESTEVDGAQVNDLLNQLTTLQAPQLTLGAFPRDRSVATITFFDFSGAAIDTVRIALAGETGESGWILENGDDVLRVFPPSLALALDLRP